MATTEFNARALFDFDGESSNELSFKADEILTITSTSTGEGWWYAQNSVQQTGAIPSNYVEIIYEAPNPPQLYSNTTYNYPDNNHTDTIIPSQTEQQYIAPIPDINWPIQEPVLQPPDQIHQSNEITTHPFPNSIQSLTTNGTPLNTIPITSDLYDSYITTVELSPPLNSVPMSILNPLTDQNTIPNQSEPWYFDDMPEPTPNHQSMPVTSLDNFKFPQAPSLMDSVYDTPSPVLIPPSPKQPNKIESTPIMSPVDLMSMNSPTSPESNLEHTPTVETKPEKKKFFTLKREKAKPEPLKRNLSMNTASETGRKPPKDDSDSNDFSEEEPPRQTTSSNSNKQLNSSGDAKAAPRARFFDKHGMDNYLLHGCKAKTDEHVEIAV